VAAATTWPDFPLVWKGMLDEVWACVSAAGVSRRCRNVMLYWDDVPHVEVGVELLEPFPLTGRITASALPGGLVAMTVHRGSYGGLGAAHQAVVRWCADQGLSPAGPRWEIYGHQDGPAGPETEVYHLLEA
jgi:effector-binding domain-containing protein